MEVRRPLAPERKGRGRAKLGGHEQVLPRVVPCELVDLVVELLDLGGLELPGIDHGDDVILSRGAREEGVHGGAA